MYKNLRDSPYLRVAVDSISEHSMFAYNYLRGDLLSFFRKDVPLPLTKRILRDALHGITALHDKGIVHTDVKPDNILIDWQGTGDSLAVVRVQVADLENVACVHDNCEIEGVKLGNWIWRSPEAHVAGPMHKPTDMFSFGLVCIYAVTKHVVLGVPKKNRPEGKPLQDLVVERQLSYFADDEGTCGLVKYFDDDDKSKGQYFARIANRFTTDNPRLPFDTWPGLDPVFADLVLRMMNVDPTRRLTAANALSHAWFADSA